MTTELQADEKSSGLRRSKSFRKSTLTRLRVTDRATGKLLVQTKLMRAGTGWKRFRRTLKRVNQENVVVDLLTRFGDEVASSTDEGSYWQD